MCFVATDRVVPFPSDKAQQMGPSGRALRVFQDGSHSLLQCLDGWTHTFNIAPLFTLAEGANQPERLSMQGVIQRLLNPTPFRATPSNSLRKLVSYFRDKTFRSQSNCWRKPAETARCRVFSGLHGVCQRPGNDPKLLSLLNQYCAPVRAFPGGCVGGAGVRPAWRMWPQWWHMAGLNATILWA